MRRLLAASLIALALPAAAAGEDRELLAAKERYLPAAARSYPRSPDGLQARYDAGRDLEEALRAAFPVRPRCLKLYHQLMTLARAQVHWAEAFDHPVRSTPPRIPRVTAGCKPLEQIRSETQTVTWSTDLGLPAFAAPAATRDPALAAKLRRATRAFRGWAGVWVHDLRTGRYAGVNERLLLPAASTVKLGVLAAMLGSSPRPDRSPLYYDAIQVGRWSSNLGANRIVSTLGLTAVYDGMRRLGMTSSTYPGLYRAGSARTAGPPGGHTRVTTAEDLGRALFRLHAAALGKPSALRATRLSRRQAAVGLSLLLDPLRVGENAGLLRPWLPRSTRVAEKNGWISDTRVTAAIVYGERGPVIVVVAAYRDRIKAADARALGKRVLAAAGLTL